MASMAVMLGNAIPVRHNKPRLSSRGGGGFAPMVVECSSRPEKKATSHHMKTRPKKKQPWDIKRKGPTAYPPLPPLPPDWTLASSEPAAEQQEEGAAPEEGDAPATTAAR